MKSIQKTFSKNTMIFLEHLNKQLDSQKIKIQEIFIKQFSLCNQKQISQIEFTKLIKFSKTPLPLMEITQIFNQIRQKQDLIYVNSFFKLYQNFITKKNQSPKLPSKLPPKPTKAPQNKSRQKPVGNLINEVKSGSRQKTQGRESSTIKPTSLTKQNQIKNNTPQKNNNSPKTAKIQQKGRESSTIKPTSLTKQNQIKNNTPQKNNISPKTAKIQQKQPLSKNNPEKVVKKIIPVQPKKSNNQKQVNKPKQQKQQQLLQIYEERYKKIDIFVIGRQPKKDNKKAYISTYRKQSKNRYITTIWTYIDVIDQYPNSYHIWRQQNSDNPELLKYMKKLQILYKKGYFYQENNIPKISKGQYISASKIFQNKNYQLFQLAQSVGYRQKSRIGLAQFIQPKDIIQGQLHNCYLLCSLSSIISRHPQAINNLFIFNKNKCNYYLIRLFIDGQWKYIQTNDYFPCKKVGQNLYQPIYARPHGQQIWVMLLQKCYAKIFGSYDSLNIGTLSEGFRTITGAPIQAFNLIDQITNKVEEQYYKQQIKQLKQKLQNAYQKKYVTCINGNKFLNNMNMQKQKQLGIFGNHGYSFLKFIQVDNVTLVRMQNPWGRKSTWSGDWSYNSKKWTPQTKQKFNYVNQPNDGSFYISWDDMLKYFGQFKICKYVPDYVHTNISLQYTPNQANYIKMIISKDGCYHFSINQQNHRKFKKQDNYKYCPARIFLAQYKNNKFQYINSRFTQKQHYTQIQANLTKGTYMISYKVDMQSQKQRSIILDSYGVQKVQFLRIGRQYGTKFYKQILKSYSQKFPGHKKEQSTKQLTFYSEYSQNRGIGFYKIVYQGSRDKIKLILIQGQIFNKQKNKMLKLQGAKLIQPSALPFEKQMSPGQEYLFTYWLQKYEFNVPFTYKIQTSKTNK